MKDRSEAVLVELVPELRAKPLPRVAIVTTSVASEESNLRAKSDFRALVLRVLGSRSIREQALFFGVPHSTYFERIRDKRTDLAPLSEWTEKLERHAQWQRLNAEFSRAG